MVTNWYSFRESKLELFCFNAFMKFIQTQSIIGTANLVYAEKVLKLKKLLPFTEVHHVGSTAVPGSLTKGDLDINIRVIQEDFDESVKILKSHYDIAQPQNWKPYFASFQDTGEKRISTGIQLSVIDSPGDCFLRIRQALLDSPEVLKTYNAMKQRHEGDNPSVYWKDKDAFFSKLLEDNKN